MGRGILLASACAGLAWSCDDLAGVRRDPAILWQVPAQAASTTPLVLESVVVLGTLDGSPIACDRGTGRARWKRELAQTEVWGAVRTAAGLAIVPQYEPWALEFAGGGVQRRFGGPDGAAGAHDVATSGDTVFGDTLFTGFAKGWVSAVDARDGQALWSVGLGEAPF